MVISRLVPISISPLEGSDSGEALQPSTPGWAAEARTWTTIWIPPWNHARAQSAGSGGRSLHGPQGQPPSLVWGPHFQSSGRPTGGVAGAGAGSWVPRVGGVSFVTAPEGTPYQCLPASYTKAPTKAPHLPARTGSRHRRADRQAGGRMCLRECACLRVSLSVCDRGRETLGASACAGASVCRSVRGALSTALLARSLPNRPTKCA